MSGTDPSGEGIGTGADGHVSLAPWEEISGTLKRVEKDGNALIVVLSVGKLVFNRESIRGTTLGQLESWEGTHVSILRTGTGESSIRVTVGRSESLDR